MTKQLERQVGRAAQSKPARAAIARVTTKAVSVGAAAAAAGRRALALGRGGALAGTRALGVAGTAGAVAAAFGIGYAIGTGLRAAWRRLQPAERNYRRSLAFIAARRKFATEHGREMTAAEVRDMGRGFQESLQ